MNYSNSLYGVLSSISESFSPNPQLRWMHDEDRAKPAHTRRLAP
jgi:hypothetical protein